jgi:TPR repeat protein
MLVPSLSMTMIAALCTANLVAARPAEIQPAPVSVPAPLLSADEAYRAGKQFEQQQNYAEAMRWYRQAATRGNALAQVAIGNLYGMGEGVSQDYGEALRWYRLAAAQGNYEAENDIGFFYLSGWGVMQDYTQALLWFRKAADQGNEVAERNIGMMHLRGLGVAQDRAEAIRWFRKAATRGDPDAKEALQALREK